MCKIYVFGRGLGYTYFEKCKRKNVSIIGYIDNYAFEEKTDNGIPILKQNEIKEDGYDYIIITVIKYKDIVESLIQEGVQPQKIVCFFDNSNVEKEEYSRIIDPKAWKIELMWKYNKEVVEPTINNLSYEIYADEMTKLGIIPQIIDIDETIRTLKEKSCSLVRFGDGEFEVMFNRTRSRFQSINADLAARLREVLNCKDDNILVAIADNYGKLNQYTDDAAQGIRCYLTPQIRKDHLSLIDLKRKYYNAYLSRPYYIFRDKSYNIIKSRFDGLKEIWKNKEILIVEGQHTRMGVGNDLLNEAKDVKRILAPDKNAFSVYNEILKKAKENGKGRLILCCLGPTATVMAYDLAKAGYCALDIGQVDTEYEWFIRGVTERCDVPYKTVSEYVDKKVFSEIQDVYKTKYEKEIIYEIE